MATIFRRGKCGMFWIKYYVHGKQVYRSLDTTEERVARRMKREIEGEDAKGSLVAPSRTPLISCLQAFCEHLITIRTGKSFKNDRSVLRMFFGPMCPALQPSSSIRQAATNATSMPKANEPKAKRSYVQPQLLEDVTTAVIEQFLARRFREDCIAPKTANRTREVLHRFFEYAIKNWNFVSPDRRHRNPAAEVERRPEPAHTIRYLSAEQITEQLAAAESNVTMYVAIAILIYAGLRREELTWLTIEDVDLKKRLIFVRAKTIDGVFWQPKTKINRVVPISQALLKILNAMAISRKSPWFIPSPTGSRWDVDNFSHKLRSMNEAAGLNWSCLDFRHTFGSHLAQRGVSLFQIATLMGNSPEICRKHYASLIPEQMHQAVEFEATALPEAERMLQLLVEQLTKAGLSKTIGI